MATCASGCFIFAEYRLRMFPGELETQLGGMRDVQGQLAQGMQQLANAVDTKLVQNDQRNNNQEGMIRDMCTALRNLGVQIGRNHQENLVMYQNVTKVEQQMECIGNAIKGEVRKVLAHLSKTSN